MARPAVRLLDFFTAYLLAGAFLLALAMGLVFSAFVKKGRKTATGVIQLYISIVDFRDSVISTIKEDVALSGFIKKVFCYHLDFEDNPDEHVRMDERIYMNNINVHPDNLLTRMGFSRSSACLVEIRAFLTMLGTAFSEKVNIIRAHDPHLLGFNACMLARLLKVPFMIQICSNYELKDRSAKGLTFRPFIFKNVERWFERAIMRASDMVMTDREHYRAFGLIPKDIPEDRYVNIGFFVNEAHYSPPDSRTDLSGRFGIGPDKDVLLYVGRLSQVKYPLDLLMMFEKVLAERSGVMLLIVGDGDLRSSMDKMAVEKGIKEKVLFIKKLSQGDLRDIYHTADIACFTSAGFTMVEAALAQRCIVAYDFEWHGEFIGHNERGTLVPFGDYGAFAKTVLELLGDPAARDRLGRAARDYAVKNYSREESIAKETEAYRAIFRRRGVALEKDV